jgi:hypothetical protein
MYGQDAVVSLLSVVQSLRLATQNDLEDQEILQNRLEKLLQMDRRSLHSQWETTVSIEMKESLE